MMDVIIKVNNQSNGRDKLARDIKRFSADMAQSLQDCGFVIKESSIITEFYYILFQNGHNKYLKDIQEVLRLGRCIDICYTALNSMHIEDPILRVTLTISKLAHALFLYSDHIVWLTKSGFLKTDSEKWNRTANKFWLLSIIANLARDFYEIVHLMDLHNSSFLKPSELLSTTVSSYDWNSRVKYMCMLMTCHKDVFIDTLKNSCDIFIPLTALGFTKLSPSTVGILGAVSSLAALVTVVKPITKLVPA